MGAKPVATDTVQTQGAHERDASTPGVHGTSTPSPCLALRPVANRALTDSGRRFRRRLNELIHGAPAPGPWGDAWHQPALKVVRDLERSQV